uniref:site-specific DNA-methyltransferase (cytosine-N(4)-specific) n=1 Tax=uncultured bacterium contig00214 TaxID=1181611 RepID=A0A806KD13_9BACT|nr:putative type II DNA modification enzyme [uncultured bacterium contig00214]
MSVEVFFENNRIYNNECVSFMQSIEDNYIDLTITSPPYDNIRNYNGYCFDCEKIAKELFRITKDGGVVVWVVGDKIEKGNKTLTSFKQALLFQEIGFNVHDTMIYKKRIPLLCAQMLIRIALNICSYLAKTHQKLLIR